MAKVLITGMRVYNFEDDQKRNVSGMSVFYQSPLEIKGGEVGGGYTCEKLNVNTGTDLYNKMARRTYDKPFEANVIFDILPNRKRPTLIDIQF